MVENGSFIPWTEEMFKGLSVPIDKRWHASNGNIEFLGFSDTQLARGYREFTQMVADGLSPVDPVNRFLCQSKLADFFPQLTATTENGHLVTFDQSVGLLTRFYGRFPPLRAEELIGGRVVIADIVVTNGIKEAAVIQRLTNNGSKPSTIEIHSYLIFQEAARRLTYLAEQQGAQLVIKAAFPLFQLDKKYQPLRTPAEGYPEGTLAMGKTEEICAPLPVEYNGLAWWNRGRNPS